MEDYEFVNGIVDEVISRITTNSTELGGIVEVLEKDEDPALIENLPVVFVIPIGDGDLTLQNIQGMDGNYVDFPIHVVGIYKYYGIDSSGNDEIAQGIRPTRNYGIICNSLFSGDEVVIDTNVARLSSSVRFGYWTSTDYTLHYFYLTITVKGINC